jgi:transcriptional regulator with XRE-family HTH domain
MLSPAQCRAARALLNWPQDQLEAQSKVAKKTIADFERGTRGRLQAKSEEAISAAFKQAGIELIAQNGGGDGVRFKRPVPRFVQIVRRTNVEGQGWIAFAADYKGARRTGFVQHAALEVLDPYMKDPAEAFDLNRVQILECAAEKWDRGEINELNQVHIRAGDLQPVPEPE